MATYTSGDDPSDQQAVQHYQQEMSHVTSDFSALSQEMMGLREQLRMAGQPLAADIVEKIQGKEKEKLQLVSLFFCSHSTSFIHSLSWILYEHSDARKREKILNNISLIKETFT